MKEKFETLKELIEKKDFEKFSTSLSSFIEDGFPINHIECKEELESEYPCGLYGSITIDITKRTYSSLLHIAISAFIDDFAFIKSLIDQGADANLKCRVWTHRKEIKEHDFGWDLRDNSSWEVEYLPSDLVKNKNLKLIAYLHSWEGFLSENSFSEEEKKEIERLSKIYKEEREGNFLILNETEKSKDDEKIANINVSEKNFFSEQTSYNTKKRKHEKSSEEDDDHPLKKRKY